MCDLWLSARKGSALVKDRRLRSGVGRIGQRAQSIIEGIMNSDTTYTIESVHGLKQTVSVGSLLPKKPSSTTENDTKSNS